MLAAGGQHEQLNTQLGGAVGMMVDLFVVSLPGAELLVICNRLQEAGLQIVWT